MVGVASGHGMAKGVQTSAVRITVVCADNGDLQRRWGEESWGDTLQGFIHNSVARG